MTTVLYLITILFIYVDNNTKIIYIVKNHQAPLYDGLIAVNVNKNVFKFTGYSLPLPINGLNNPSYPLVQNK